MSPRLSAIRTAPLAAALLAAAFALAFASEVPVRALMLAAAYAENLLHHPETIGTFQLSRLPSFFPDLTLYVAITALRPSLRAAAMAYGAVSYVATVLLAGAVVGRMAGSTWRRGSSVFLAISAIALLLEMAAENSTGTLFYIFIPINHAGSVWFSLAGLLLARRVMQRPSPLLAAALGALAALGMLSDQLFFGSFAAPLVAAAAAAAWRTPWPNVRRCAGVAAIGVLGCAAGALLDHGLFAAVLVRQPDIGIDLPQQARRFGDLLRQPNLRATALLAAAVAVLPAAWRRSRELAFWWAAGTVTVAGFLALLPLLYFDITSARYVQPVRWWAVIVLASAVLRAAPALAVPAAGVSAALLCLVMAARGQDLLQPSKLLYRPAVAECLQSWASRGLLHAGIAPYWQARVIEAATNWQLQVEQVVDAGQVLVWGNNPYYYTHDKKDPAKPALFDFVVIGSLDPSSIRARFGKPDQVLPCPGSDVWVYQAPGGIGRSIGRLDLAAAGGGLLDGPACFGPLDFVTVAGPVSPDGVTIPPTAPPHGISTYGPYVRLRAGQWRLRLAYRLDGPGSGAKWDVAANGGHTLLQSGPLPPGGTAQMVRDIDLTVERDTPSVELRTYLQPGDVFHIDGLAISRAGSPGQNCGS